MHTHALSLLAAIVVAVAVTIFLLFCFRSTIYSAVRAAIKYSILIERMRMHTTAVSFIRWHLNLEIGSNILLT